MPRRTAALAIAALLAGICSRVLSAHAGPRLTDPLEGATLGDTPTMVRLVFTEKPEASLSLIRVLDTAGRAYQVGQGAVADDDPLALAVRVRPLERGVYIVNWRVVSAVDGHVTSGAYAFGVRMAPTGAVAASIVYPRASTLEIVARWTLLVGFVVLLGAVTAALGAFGGKSDLTLAAVGWLVAIVGAALMAEAQRRGAAVSFVHLVSTSIGRALIARSALIVLAGASLILARSAASPMRLGLHRVGLALTATLTLAAIAVHVAAGHPAAGDGRFLRVPAQWVHIGASALWLGGLGALLLSVRGASADHKTVAVRRFSRLAAVSLIVVAATGTLRTANEIASVDQLLSTPYGRIVLVKMALLAAIALFGAMNRWWYVPRATTNLGPLRRAAGAELVFAVGALAAAAILATLPPPAAAEPGLRGLSAAGTDFGTSVRARLRTVSDQAGANRFIVTITDYDSNALLRDKRVSLQFTPADDPGVPSTTLALAPAPDGSYQGSGANLAFEGRWHVSVLVEGGATSVDVPLDVETRTIRQPFVFVAREKDRAPTYTVDVPGGTLRISPDPERAGHSQLYVTTYDRIGDPRPVDPIVATIAAGGVTRQLLLRKISRSGFVAEIELVRGRQAIAVVARTLDGTRLRVLFDVHVTR